MMHKPTSLDIAGLLADIIDVLSKLSSVIAELRCQWQDANPALMSPESQLAILNAHFNTIQDRTENPFNDPHQYVVIEELNRSMACCRLLVNRIDWEVAPLQKTPEIRLDTTSKLRLLLQTEEFDSVKRMIERQESALTLLLTEYNMTAPSEEKRATEQPQVSKTSKKMETETESLLVHRDVDSTTMPRTVTSMSSSRRPAEFSFDRDLFNTRIYQKWIHGSVKKSLHEQQSDEPYRPRPDSFVEEQKEQSRDFDDLIEGKAHNLCRGLSVLILGSESRFRIMRMMLQSIHDAGLPEDVLLERKRAVLNRVCQSAKALVGEMRDMEIAPKSDQIWEHAEFITAYVPKLGPPAAWFDPRLKTAIEYVRQSPYYRDVSTRQHGFYVSDSAEYLCHEIGTISSPAYLPNELDIYHTSAGPGDFYRCKLPLGVNHLKFELFDIGRRRGRIRNWITCFSGMTCIFFVADLDSYDDVLLEEERDEDSSPTNRLLDSVSLFDFVVNLPKNRKTSVILLLTNVDKFREKLKTSPLDRYFPDYSEGNDITKAISYLHGHFERANRAGLELYTHLTPPNSASNLDLLSATVRETILTSLQASGVSV